MGSDRPRGKKAVAAEVWRLMLECAMSQFGRASGILQDLGLTPGHMKLLMQLEEGDGRAMGSLAQSFHCDASTMTWLVDRLEERGLVERRMLPADRRVKAVALTPLGAETKAEITGRVYAPPEALDAVDRPALEELREALERIRESLAAVPETGTGTEPVPATVR
ncbi:MAG: MarR family winged helix-turn-helix transcriptional regulator [Actinomycetota bacterium]